MAIGFGSFILAMGLMGMLGSDFMPDYDRGDFQVGFKVEAGASLQAARAKARQLEDLIRGPEVEHVYTTIGTGLNGAITDGTIYVKLTEGRDPGVLRSPGRILLAQALGPDHFALKVKVGWHLMQVTVAG
jgi:multidrug efflux pump subunit AcrB